MIKLYWIELEELTNFCKFCDRNICYETQVFRDCYFLKYVKKQRRDKVLRCKNKKDKLRSLLTGLLLRFALEQEGIDYDTAEFSYGEHGKPMLMDYKYKNCYKAINLPENIYQSINMENITILKRIENDSILYQYKIVNDVDMQKENKIIPIQYFFSLTHSSNYVACAISDENIGIDLEETNRKLFLPRSEKQLISMAKRVCTQAEYTYFSTLSREEQIRVYLEIWTRKESFAKADGRGLAIGLDKVEVLGLEKLEDRTDNKLACVHEQVTKEDYACPFYTTWITDSVCMSVYSQKSKTISNIPLTQNQIYEYVEKNESIYNKKL